MSRLDAVILSGIFATNLQLWHCVNMCKADIFFSPLLNCQELMSLSGTSVNGVRICLVLCQAALKAF